MRMLFPFLLLSMLFASASYAQDMRYQVDISPDAARGETVASVHANIQQAVDQALVQLWTQLLPPEEADAMPKDIHGIRFLQRAIPTATGVTVIFDEKRIDKFLSEYKAAQSGIPSTPGESSSSENEAAPVHAGLMLSVTIEHPSTLAEQVLLESDLQSDARVASLIPVQLNDNSCRYQLQLKVADDSWIPLWFAKRGLAVTPLPEGWIAH